MKKWLLSLTMGAMFVSLGQASAAEASFSSKTPTFDINNSINWSERTQVNSFEFYNLTNKQMVEELYAQLTAAGVKPATAKYKAQELANTKPVTKKPVVEQKPQETATPVAEKPAAPTATPVAEKAATPTATPVAEKPATQQPVPAPQPAQETTAPAKQESAAISSIEQQVLTLTNQERANEGLKPLATDAKLMDAAREKSTDMRTGKYFSHTSPTLGSPFDRMKALGIDYKAAAENIAMGQTSAEEVVKAWMNSPGHRANIMNGNFTHIGIGYDSQGHYWTQQFITK